MNQELLTADELAIRLRVRPETIRIWGRDGVIPRVCISAKTIRYDVDAVITSLKENLSTPPSRAIAPAPAGA